MRHATLLDKSPKLHRRSQARPTRVCGLRSQAGDLSWHSTHVEVLEDRRLLTVTEFGDIASQFQSELANMQQFIGNGVDAFRSGVNGTLPLADGLAESLKSQFDRFGTAIHDAIDELGNVETDANGALQTALLDALGPSGLQILVDRTTSSTTTGVGVDDILITSLGNDRFGLQARLFLPLAQGGTPLDFDLGLPGLPIELTSEGSLLTSIGMAYELAFQYDVGGIDVSFDSSKTLAGFTPIVGSPIDNLDVPMAFFVTASPSPDFSIGARIGFVQGDLAPLVGSPNALVVTVGVDDITPGLFVAPEIYVDGAADLNLRLSGSFAGTDGDFPGIDTDFHLHWEFDSTAPEANAPEFRFDNVYLNLGGFLSDLLEPVLTTIQDATEPLKPVLKVLNTPIPGLSDLAVGAGLGEVTLLDLAGAVAPYSGYGPLFDLSEKVVNILDLVQSIDIGSSVRLPLGGFNLDNYDLRNSIPARDINDLEVPNLTDLEIDPQNLIALGQSFAEIVNDLPVPDEVKGILSDVTAGLNNGFEISFPILDNPAQAIFNMLLGKDSDLFSLEAEAHLDAYGASAPTGLSIFNQAIVYGGQVSVDFEFKFGYDTYGLRTLINNLADGNTSNILSDVLDGFYIATDSYFSLAGDIYAGVGPSFGIVEVLIEGHASTGDDGEAPVTVTVANPTSDGKQRFAEFSSVPFAASGQFVAGLGLELRIGKEILGQFVGVRKRFDVANEVLVTFVPPPPPTLASQPDTAGDVTLFLGVNAGQRQGDGLDQVDGDESFTIRHLETTPEGETLKISAFGKSQILTGVRSLSAVDALGNLSITVLPGVTSNVNFTGGQGTARLDYRGSGNATLVAGNLDSELQGGLGFNQLFGGAGNDIITLGHSGNIVHGGGGQNTIIVDAPVTAAGDIIAGDAANNSLIVIGDQTTQLITAQASGARLDLGIKNSPTDPLVHVLASNVQTLFVNAQTGRSDFEIGDLSATGVSQILIDAKSTLPVARNFRLDTSASNGVTSIDVDELVFTYNNPSDSQPVTEYGANIVNQTTGISVQVFGLANADVFTLEQSGGSLTVDPLHFPGGTLVHDTASRAGGAGQVVTIYTTAMPAGLDLETRDDQGDFEIEVTDALDFRLHGVTDVDSLSLQVAPSLDPAMVNLLDVDASGLVGSFRIDTLGDAASLNEITLQAASPELVTTIDGHAASTRLHLGSGQLEAIQSDVTAANFMLSVDNSAATVGSYLKLAASTFGDWIVPNTSLTPRLNFTGIYGAMDLKAGAGDRFQLDVTPGALTSLTMSNDTATLDPVYTANWSVPLTLNGNFSLYLGQRLLADGTVDRVKSLTQVGVPVVMNFAGSAATEIVLDAALDAPGAQYTMGNTLHDPNLLVSNLTVGLGMTLNGLRLSDTVRFYISGATVNGDLKEAGLATLVFDGFERLAGANPSAPNIVNLTTSTGSVFVDPVGPNDTQFLMYHTVFSRGSLPEDVLSISTSTGGIITVDGSELRGRLDFSVRYANYGLFLVALHEEELAAQLAGRPMDPNLVLTVMNTNVAINRVRHDLAVNVSGTSDDRSILVFLNQFGVDSSSVQPDPLFRQFLDAVARNAEIDAGFLHEAFRNNYWDVIYDPTHVTVGDGQLSKIEGTVSVTQAALTVENRDGTASNILSLTDTLLSGWQTDSGSAASLTIGQVQGEFVVNASPTDRFAIEDTPRHWWETQIGTTEALWVRRYLLPYDEFLFPIDRTIIRNIATSGTPSEVYIMGKDLMPLEVTGNFNLYVGRRLLASGEVQAVGHVMEMINPPPGHYTRPQGVSYKYQGEGLGIAVWDASADTVTPALFTQSGIIGFYGTFASSLEPGRTSFAYLMNGQYGAPNAANFPQTRLVERGRLVFDANTDFTFYAPVLPENLSTNWGGSMFNNPTTGPIHYYDNPSSVAGFWNTIYVGNTEGVVDIHGTPGVTRVQLDPRSLLTFFGPGLDASPNADLSRGNHLVETVRADIYIENAAVRITPSALVNATPPPLTVRDIVIKTNSIEGLIDGVLHLSNLADDTTFDTGAIDPRINVRKAGLYFEMPRYVTNVRVEGTSETSYTTLDNGDVPSPVHVVGSDGSGLVFGGRLAATQVVIGDGTLQGILAPIYIRSAGFQPTWIVDDRLDIARQVTIAQLSSSQTEVPSFYQGKISGIAPAPIYFLEVFSEDLFDNPVEIHGSDGSTFNITYAAYDDTTAWRLYAGENTTVNVSAIFGYDSPSLDIYGAESVTAQVGSLSGGSIEPLRVLPHPDRPSDATELTLNFVNTSGLYPIRVSTVNDAPQTRAIELASGSFVAGRIEYQAATTSAKLIDLTQINTLIGPEGAAAWQLTPTGGTLNNELTFERFKTLSGRGSANTLIGRNQTNLWDFNAAGGGKVNTNVFFTGMQNVLGGPANDDFYFSLGGSLAGNLDGGLGTNKLFYRAGVVTSGEVLDLPSGIAPKIAGQTLRIQNAFVAGSLQLMNPGTQQSFEGVPISLPIQLATPSNNPVSYAASGLPSGLSINGATGVISGSIGFHFQDRTFSTTVSVSDGFSSSTINFTWLTRMGFRFNTFNVIRYAGQTLDEPLDIYNPYGHNITVSAVGLPEGLSITPSNRIVGTISDFAFLNSPYTVQFTAVNHTMGYTVEQTRTWTILPGFVAYSPGNRANYAGAAVELPLQTYNPNGHELEVTASGLPAGLSVDPSTGTISGVISTAAISPEPHDVVLTVTDVTIAYTIELSFTWTVLEPLSLDRLNSGTPAGTPFLAGLLDPEEEGSLGEIAAVTFDSLPGEPTVVYFRFGSELWQHRDGNLSKVESGNPGEPILSPEGLMAVPGRGLLFFDGYAATLWWTGGGAAHKVNGASLYNSQGPTVVIGDKLYFSPYDATDLRQKLFVADFSGSGDPVVSLVSPNLINVRGLTEFAGGVLFFGQPTDNTFADALYWHNPATGAVQRLAASDMSFSFSDLVVAPAENGSQNLFYLLRNETFRSLNVLNSAELTEPSPTTVATFNNAVQVGSSGGSPLRVVGNRVVLGVTAYNGTEHINQFWVSDGTTGGTAPIANEFAGYGSTSEQISFGGSLYFVHSSFASNVTESTVVARMWKVDPVSRSMTLWAEFRGEDNYWNPPFQLTAGGDKLYFSAWSAAAGARQIWFVTADSGTPQLVLSKANNPYLDPRMDRAVFAGGALYFSALAPQVINSGGGISVQVWVLGPAFGESAPGDLDADGSINAKDINLLFDYIVAADLRGDLNGDSAVDDQDLEYLVHEILDTEFGDANLDGFVDAADLSTVRRGMGSPLAGPRWAEGDFNGDGLIDAADLVTVRRYIGFARVAENLAETPSADIVAEPIVAIADDEHTAPFVPAPLPPVESLRDAATGPVAATSPDLALPIEALPTDRAELNPVSTPETPIVPRPQPANAEPLVPHQRRAVPVASRPAKPGRPPSREIATSVHSDATNSTRPMVAAAVDSVTQSRPLVDATVAGPSPLTDAPSGDESIRMKSRPAIVPLPEVPPVAVEAKELVKGLTVDVPRSATIPAPLVTLGGRDALLAALASGGAAAPSLAAAPLEALSAVATAPAHQAWSPSLADRVMRAISLDATGEASSSVQSESDFGDDWEEIVESLSRSRSRLRSRK